MKIFVTGGLGYVGTELSIALSQSGHQITVFDAGWFGNYLPISPDIEIIIGDLRTMNLSLKGYDAVIHLANIANDPSADLNQNLSWEVNVLATYQLLQQSILSGVRTFIYASSGSVYGISNLEKVDENAPLLPISAYNKTKMIAEQVLLSSKDQIKVFNIRPATVCGFSRRMRLDLAVNLLTFQAITKGEITVLGGKQFRPNIHIDDMIAVYMHFLRNSEYLESGNYNAGFENLTIETIADRICEVIPANKKFKVTNDIRSYRLDSGKLLATGFSPRKGISEAIRELKDKFENNHLQDRSEWYTVETMKRLGLG